MLCVHHLDDAVISYMEPDEDDPHCRHLNDPDDCPECEEQGSDEDVDEETMLHDLRHAEAEVERMKNDAACDAAYFAQLDR